MNKKWITFIKTLRVEPYMFLFIFAFALKIVTLHQLFQDKLCHNNYNLSDEFCSDINKDEYHDSPDKLRILEDSTVFYLYIFWIQTPPGILLSFFIGSWSDKYKDGRKILLVFGMLGAALETTVQLITAFYFESDLNLMLISFAFSGLSGGHICSFTAIYSYASKTTIESMKSIRFAILEMTFYYAMPLGIFCGGLILNTTPFTLSGFHNYISVFIIALVCQLLGIIWVFSVIHNEVTEFTDTINDKMDIKGSIKKPKSSNLANLSEIPDGMVIQASPKEHWTEALKHIFELRNIKSMYSTAVKTRENKGNIQMVLLFLSMEIVSFCYIGTMTILFQFAQKSFGWNSEKFSNWDSLGCLFSATLVVILVPILVKAFNVKDSTIGLIGVISLILQNLIRGSFQDTTGFIISYFIGSLNGVPQLAIRSIVSKIVSREDIGQIFGLLFSLESMTPILASTFFTTIFKASLHWHAGLVLQLAALLLCLPLLIFIWIRFILRSF